ncbi:MAG: DUF732 domain-containing protein [Leptolyngbyaceae cyanobacterium CRU_2_3]|nr:DUF732 domain-containing protein [Leptolyngbyaceae cyanobacterium CRU_2_3]
MQTQEGQIVNLENLCRSGNRQNPADALSADEQEFIGDLNQLLQDSYGVQVASSVAPQTAISQAKEICNALDLGTFVDYRRTQAQIIAGYRDPTTQRIANSQARAIQTLAPKYFCPAFAD